MEEQNTLVTKYSHAFLVGSFNGVVTPELLANDSSWNREIIKLSPSENERRYSKDRGYNGLCTIYYKAHLDAMIEGQNIKRPVSLSETSHFVHDYGKSTATQLTLRKDQGKTPFLYSFYLQKLHFFFFPLGVVLFAIEIDDSNTDLNELTAAHYALTNFLDVDAFNSKELVDKLTPIIKYIPKSDSSKLNKDGNKLKIFQTVEIEKVPKSEDLFNAMLYEIGTSSPIGSVLGNTCPDLKPSRQYFDSIIKANLVSTFDSWKGLGLMDSFTVLGGENSFIKDDWIYMYFPLVYLRCLFVKIFCFSRNNSYRQSDQLIGGKLRDEIAIMEKYYFYDNISYNFQPNLLYAAMAKGLEIKAERSELSRQIKEYARRESEDNKEKEEQRLNNTLAGVSVFAVFSVVWDLWGIIDKSEDDLLAKCLIGIAVIVIIALFGRIYSKQIKKLVTKTKHTYEKQ